MINMNPSGKSTDTVASLGIITGIVDMKNVTNELSKDNASQMYYSNGYVRVRIPQIHGIPDYYVDAKGNAIKKPETEDNQKLDFTPSKDLPWARLVVPAGFDKKCKSMRDLRDKLGFDFEDEFPSVYLMTVNGEISNLLLLGRLTHSEKLGERTEKENTNNGSSTVSSGDIGDAEDTDSTIRQGVDGFVYPCVVPSISEVFGEYFIKYSGDSRPYHVGMDIPKNGKAPVIHPIANGTVYNIWSEAGSGGWGNFVVVKHKLKKGLSSKTFFTGYAHLSSVNVSTGSEVTTDSALGVMGHTGECYPSGDGGTHLHMCCFITNKNGTSESAGMPQGYVQGNAGVRNSSCIQGTSPGYYYFNPKKVIENGKDWLWDAIKNKK